MGNHLCRIRSTWRNHLPSDWKGPVNAISTTNLGKRYGSQFALNGINLEIPRGSIYGLLGPNGAGKTTALEIIAGLRHPSFGEVRIQDQSGYTAYCPDVAEFEPWLSPVEVLEVSAGLLGRPKPLKKINDVLARVGLKDAAARRVSGFSRGMLARLGLGAALICDPEILLLDEPVAALDPLGQHEVMDLLANLGSSVTVVISSHDLTEIEQRCDTVGVLNAGELIHQGPLSDLLASHARHIWHLEIRPPVKELVARLMAMPWASGVTEISPGILEIHYLSSEEAERDLPAVLASSGSQLVSLIRVKPTLEEVFLSITRSGIAQTETGES